MHSEPINLKKLDGDAATTMMVAELEARGEERARWSERAASGKLWSRPTKDSETPASET